MADTGTDQTNSASTRWAYTNDILALFLILAFAGLTFAPLTPYVADHAGINPVVLTAFTTAFGIAIAWAFGPDAVQAWQEAKGGG